jgi:hypothetical protein
LPLGGTGVLRASVLKLVLNNIGEGSFHLAKIPDAGC